MTSAATPGSDTEVKRLLLEPTFYLASHFFIIIYAIKLVLFSFFQEIQKEILDLQHQLEVAEEQLRY